ncbi:hypothetical protein DPMN_058481 [Dreissena polymorpha]|uniref:Uncharacterized protein n=1 Tax=Dreissena polymorpha TaxID=45954 RepID=A0A9D4C292_DREPO|nr:hypothetical protein DPMN_058481 [Dreissena polymorpha]
MNVQTTYELGLYSDEKVSTRDIHSLCLNKLFRRFFRIINGNSDKTLKQRTDGRTERDGAGRQAGRQQAGRQARRKEGRKVGRKKGRKEGRKEGKKAGRKVGRKEGRNEIMQEERKEGRKERS